MGPREQNSHTLPRIINPLDIDNIPVWSKPPSLQQDKEVIIQDKKKHKKTASKFATSTAGLDLGDFLGLPPPMPPKTPVRNSANTSSLSSSGTAPSMPQMRECIFA